MLDLKKLRCFVAVAEELNFHRAAARLHMTQPPLTRQIATLERELGMCLLQRSRQAVALSPQGRLFFPHAQALLRQAAQAEAFARTLAAGGAGHIDIGYASSVPLSDLFSDTIRAFSQRHPDVTLSFKELASKEQIARIAGAAMDIGFIRPLREAIPATLGARRLRGEALVVALPSGHRLAGSAAIDIATLAGETFILFPPAYGSGLNDTIHLLCAQAGFVAQVGLAAEQMTTIIALVAAGQGISLVPQAMRALRRRGVSYVPLLNRPSDTDMTLVYRRDGRPPCVDAFIELAGELALAAAAPG